MNLDLTAKLAAFSMRMASVAQRNNSGHFVHCGLLAQVLDQDIVDPRDVYTLCCVLYDSAIRIAMTPQLIFRKVSHFATPLRRTLLEDYLSGPAHMRSLRSMGVAIIQTPEGLSYAMNR